MEEDEEKQLRSHLTDCDRCTGRLSAQQNHRRAFELMPVPSALQQAPVPTLWNRLTQGLWVGPLLVAALALMVVSPKIVDEIRTKGNHQIEILVEDYGTLDVGEAIRPGDRLQLRIPPGEWVEVWVGDGENWLGSFPVHPDQQWQLVPFSLKVDEAPGPEQIVVLMANHPIDEDEAYEALSGDALGGLEVQTITLLKEL